MPEQPEALALAHGHHMQTGKWRAVIQPEQVLGIPEALSTRLNPAIRSLPAVASPTQYTGTPWSVSGKPAPPARW